MASFVKRRPKGKLKPRIAASAEKLRNAFYSPASIVVLGSGDSLIPEDSFHDNRVIEAEGIIDTLGDS